MKLALRRRVRVLFLLAFVPLAGCGIFPYPTDQAMEEKFRSDEASFHRLVEMFRADSQLSSVNNKAAYMSFDQKVDLPKQRMDEYRSLLKKLGLGVVSRGEKTGYIYMKAWYRSSFLIGGSSKYYLYAENWPEPLVDSLDKLESGGNDAYAFKKISENWYMHLDIW